MQVWQKSLTNLLADHLDAYGWNLHVLCMNLQMHGKNVKHTCRGGRCYVESSYAFTFFAVTLSEVSRRQHEHNVRCLLWPYFDSTILVSSFAHWLFHKRQLNGSVSQLAEDARSDRVCWKFESFRFYQKNRFFRGLAKLANATDLSKKMSAI